MAQKQLHCITKELSRYSFSPCSQNSNSGKITLLFEMSSSTVSKMRGAQTLPNINHFIGGHNLFQTKRTYVLNKGEKTPFRKIVIRTKITTLRKR